MSKDLAKELGMNRIDETSRTSTPTSFGDYRFDERFDNAMPQLDASEELDWLMSLALDEALDANEAERLEMLLRQEPEYLDRWAAWQAVDSNFQQMPSVLPSPDFGAKFAQRLEIQERQRRLRTGFIFGIAAVVLWGSALTGTVMLGALVWSNQGAWLGGLIHNMAYWWAAMGQFGQALFNTGEALWAAPQTRAVLLCYLVAAFAILVGWFAFLRRSLREMPLVEA
jgi:hypothetical protein